MSLSTVPAAVSIIDNSDSGQPDEFVAFIRWPARASGVTSVEGIYDVKVQTSRFSTVITGKIDMRYVSAEVQQLLLHAALMDAELSLVGVECMAGSQVPRIGRSARRENQSTRPRCLSL
jgi:hypothetical protein